MALFMRTSLDRFNILIWFYDPNIGAAQDSLLATAPDGRTERRGPPGGDRK